MPVPDDTPILKVVSQRFDWTAAEGFLYSGEERQEGLNRTREGALARIASHLTLADHRQRNFLSTLFTAEELATIGMTVTTFRDGHHIVWGRRFAIEVAEVGD